MKDWRAFLWAGALLNSPNILLDAKLAQMFQENWKHATLPGLVPGSARIANLRYIWRCSTLVPQEPKKVGVGKMLYTKITIGDIHPMTLQCILQENSGLDVTPFTIR